MTGSSAILRRVGGRCGFFPLRANEYVGAERFGDLRVWWKKPMNLGASSSCREIGRPQERTRIKQASSKRDEKNVAQARGNEGWPCYKSPLNCMPRRKTKNRQTTGCRNHFNFHFLFPACSELTQRMHLAIIMKIKTLRISLIEASGVFWSLFRDHVGRSTSIFQSI